MFKASSACINPGVSRRYDEIMVAPNCLEALIGLCVLVVFMESCQICGKEAVGEGFVEGAKVPLCNLCLDFASKFDVYDEYKPPVAEKKFAPKPQVVERFVDDWTQKIKSAREKKGWDRSELGKRLFISETDIKAFEDGRRKPEPSQREKIERELGVSLIESEVLESVEKKKSLPPKSGQALTLGDLVKIKKK